MESGLFWKYSAGKSPVGGAAYVSLKNHHVGRILGGIQSKGEKNTGGAGQKGITRRKSMEIQDSKQMAVRRGKEYLLPQNHHSEQTTKQNFSS